LGQPRTSPKKKKKHKSTAVDPERWENIGACGINAKILNEMPRRGGLSDLLPKEN